MGQIITSIEQVTPEWLGQVLKQPVSDIETEIAKGGYEGHKWFIRATGQDGTKYRLFLKMGDSYEARFYKAMQNHADEMPIVPCYDVLIDADKAHILLKDLRDTHEARPPSQLPPLGHECEAIIDGLADIHAHWWDNYSVFGNTPSPDQVRQDYQEDVDLYPEFSDFMGDRLSEHRREIYEAVAQNLPDLMVTRFSRGNLTLVFEDVHSGNFLYPRNASDQLYFIDWEQWGINLGMNDLAYMMALFWSSERRSRYEIPYLKRYHERITTKGVNYSWDALWDDYRLCVLRFLFRPAYQLQRGGIIDVWWNHYERIMVAYDELNCAELLD